MSQPKARRLILSIFAALIKQQFEQIISNTSRQCKQEVIFWSGKNSSFEILPDPEGILKLSFEHQLSPFSGTAGDDSRVAVKLSRRALKYSRYTLGQPTRVTRHRAPRQTVPCKYNRPAVPVKTFSN